MICPKCKAHNEAKSNFCTNCGHDLRSPFESTIHKKKSNSDIFILIYLLFLFISEFARFVIQRSYDTWYDPPYKYLFILLNFLGAGTLIFLGLALRDSGKRTLGIIISILYILYVIAMNIEWALGL